MTDIIDVDIILVNIFKSYLFINNISSNIMYFVIIFVIYNKKITNYLFDFILYIFYLFPNIIYILVNNIINDKYDFI